MNILITGGAGFIGSHLVDSCIDAGHTVCIVDNFSSGLRENIVHHANNSRVIICEADITNRDRMDEIFSTFLPGAVFHLAAQINVRESMKNPAKDISINIL